LAENKVSFDAPQPQDRLVGLLTQAFFQVALPRRGQMPGPGGERIIHLSRIEIGVVVYAGRIEQRRGRLLPQVSMLRQLRVINAEGGHKRGVMGSQEAGVVTQMLVGGGEALGVVVGRGCGHALRVFHQRPLQLVGDNAQLVTTHVD